MPLQFIFANNAGSTLAGPINNTTTAISVSSGGGAIFPNPVVGTQQFAITLIDAATGLREEICYVTAVSVDTFTVLRGQEGTTAQNWLAGDLCQELWTAGQCAALIQSNQVFTNSNTYYVNVVTGNDSNPGTNSLPFRTLQGAVDVISGLISESAITLNVASGTNAGCNIGASQIAGWFMIGPGVSNGTISATTTSVNTGRGLIVNGSQVTISGFTLTAINECILANAAANVRCFNCNFIGIATTSVAIGSYNGGAMSCNNLMPNQVTNSTYTISGTFSSIFNSIQSGSMRLGYVDNASTANSAFTFGTTTVAVGVVVTATGGVILINGTAHVTFAGSTPTGKKYDCTNGGTVSANGVTIPGSVAGVAASSATITTATGYLGGTYIA